MEAASNTALLFERVYAQIDLVGKISDFAEANSLVALKSMVADLEGSLSHREIIAPEVVIVGGEEHRRDHRNGLLPISTIRPQDLLQDETVRKIIGYARPLSGQIARFYGYTINDIVSLMDLIRQQYGARLGGRKGNVTLATLDGLYKVELRIAQFIEFGPELQIAKELTDECMAEWSAEGAAEIRAIVMSAFNVDKGQLNQAALLGLLKHGFTDERWQRAMQAIRDAIRPTAKKQYIRFWQRPTFDGRWQSITISLAQV